LVQNRTMRDAAIAFAALAAFMVAARYLLRPGRSRVVSRHVPRTDGPLVLRPPRRNAVMLGITALIPAGVLGSMTLRIWALGRTGLAGLLMGIVATLLPVAVAVYEFAYAARACVVVHDTGLERVGVARRRLVGWGSISKVAFNPVNHWFFVTVKDESHLWLPADVPGMGEFAGIALRRLPPAVFQADPVALEVLDELADSARAAQHAGDDPPGTG
jgi:hypothetical protein